MQSFLSQAEYAGEISLGLLLGLAQATSIAVGMFGASALAALAGVLVVRSRAARLSANR